MSLMITPKSIFQELDNMFTTTFSEPTRLTSTASTLVKGTAVSEDQNSYILSYDLPGYEKKNISVELDPTTRYVTVKADPTGTSEVGYERTTAWMYNELLNTRKYSYKTKLVWPRIDLATAPRVLYENGLLRVIFNKLPRANTGPDVLKYAPE